MRLRTDDVCIVPYGLLSGCAVFADRDKSGNRRRSSKQRIKGTVDKKLSANLEELKAKGYPFTCKIFEDMGHGGLIGENTERFIEEVDAVHRQSKKETEKRV